MSNEGAWIVVGFVGQAFFSARFLVQWLASERARRSVVPMAFWFFSLGGGAILLAYALFRGDPVFIAGQGVGLFIYVRNLVLIRREALSLPGTDREPHSESPAGSPSGSPSV